MAPDHNCKLSFSEWITRPEQQTKENSAAFERILAGLVAIIEEDGAKPALVHRHRRMIHPS